MTYNNEKPEKNISSPWDVDVRENNIGEPVKLSGDNLPYPYTTMTIHQPEVICECDLFGQRQMVISFHRSDNFPIPNRWIRFWTKVFFNSKWKFEK
jgi:hypothetical protein